MKQLKLFFLLFALMLSVSANAVIQEGSCGDNVNFVLNDDGTLVISGTGDMKDYYAYKDDYAPWYTNREKIIKATINDGVTCIGKETFYECSGLNSIDIPNSVTSIGASAFEGCSGLTSVKIPNSVTSIESRAFYNCSGLTSATIGNSVASIESWAFYNCSGLSSITIPNSVKSIGGFAFESCHGLTSVTIGNSITSIESYAFYGCSSLASITIPDSMTSIKNGTFESCSSLTTVTIPNSVTSIGDYAFEGCSGLISVTIPNSVKSIGNGAFFQCSHITSVNINSIEAWCSIVFGSDPSNPLYYAHNLYLNGQKVTSLVIPETVEIVKNYTFAGCTSLTEIWCQRENPPIVYGQSFDSSIYTKATLNVPANCGEAYKAHDIWGKFTNILAGGVVPETKKCETPTITFDTESNKIIVSSATDGAVINTTVSNSDCKTYTTNEIPLSGTFTITAYAKKEGYENSETTTKQITLSAVEKIVEVEKEVEVFIYDDTHANIDLPTGERVTIEIREGIVTIKSLPINSTVYVYTEGGELWETRRVNSASLTLDLPRHSVYIIKTSGKTFKVKI